MHQISSIRLILFQLERKVFDILYQCLSPYCSVVICSIGTFLLYFLYFVCVPENVQKCRADTMKKYHWISKCEKITR